MKDGDLWRSFLAAVVAKTPWAVWLPKVKGHAADEQVQEGKVPEEQNIGNDFSDEVAGIGFKDEQEKRVAVAALYSRRNEKYRDFINRVQQILANVKKDEKGVAGTNEEGGKPACR